MTSIQNEIYINAPVEQVYEFYTNPDNIKKAWPQDIVKESKNISGQKSEEGSKMFVKGEHMGQEAEMIVEVTDKEQNKRLVTEQKPGPFKYWKSTQEFNGNDNNTHVRHSIDYELPTTGKIANFLSGDQTNKKLKEGLGHAAQTVKQNWNHLVLVPKK
ncbi:MAG TPA: SRPBCC domain-containing protein [Nitrososphaeraceae archaeon]|jgi:ligand-binding SRPBCC domain-containing protein|nr:SRPBCC domain-containing protein [Nitrososphaeraceae archaeon]